MKVVKYDQEVKMVCPVCGKVVMDTSDGPVGELKACKHVAMWYHNSNENIIYASRLFKKFLDTNYRTFRKIVKQHNMTVVRYKGGDIGGCFKPIDTIAFLINKKGG